jgi:hypothetical protein
VFHEKVIERRLASLQQGIRQIDPGFGFKDYSPAEVDEWVEQLRPVYDPLKNILLRSLTVEEEAFVRHELSRCKADFRYWLSRYAWIKNKHAQLIRVTPTHVQELLLQRIAKEELRSVTGRSGDGILLASLKARQLGVSTVSECIICHRVFFYGNITGLIASDVDDHTMNLYEMCIRLLENLPWWMVPRSDNTDLDYRPKNKLISFHDQDSLIRFSSGKNMQGGQGQEKGSLGTGSTPHLAHVSEFALWMNAEQVYDALLPSIPMSPKTFVIIESTAKGRGNAWHEAWVRAKKGLGRLVPVFFPFYTDPNDYRLPSPSDWIANDDTVAFAERVRATSHVWLGSTHTLSRDQMYWYERTKAEYREARMLYKFLAEYAADDESAFQASTVGVFPSELIEDMRNKATQPVVIDIRKRLQNVSV